GFGFRGAIASSLTLIALSIGGWLLGASSPRLWLAAAPLATALVLGLTRWPSRQQAAVAADQRLALDERLATALEILSGSRHPGRFDGLQIEDALGHARSTPSFGVRLDRRSRIEAWCAAFAVVLAAGSLALPSLPRQIAPRSEASAVQDAGVVDASQDRPLADDIPIEPPGAGQPSLAPSRPSADLARRVQQEQAERSDLDQLSRALGSISAGQTAANAIQQGDFAAAAEQVANLGDEADQLSDAAKRQLARALDQAAAATSASDRPLSDREHQAAQALNRAAYGDQRQALRALAEQVPRSGAQSVPADQLERDMGQLRQQNGGATPSQSAAPATTGVGAGDQNQRGAPGVGTGADPDMFASQPSRVDTAGEAVQVPTRLSDGPGVRPADGTEQQLSPDGAPAGRSVAELAQSQQTGQVAPEQNLVPGEQRPVVRGYFR
ncbi:MAG TPA: hypothetical protein VF937_01545, partial [Chloroflexota bacterium]